MTDPVEIRKLARMRLDEAIILFDNGMMDGAFYLAGYSVELMLKAKICDHLSVPNLFDEQNLMTNQISGIGEIRKLAKTHSLFTLLLLSGLNKKYDQEKAKNPDMMKTNALLFGNWDENVRYKPCGHMQNSDVKTLLDLLKKPDGLLTWIEKN